MEIETSDSEIQPDQHFKFLQIDQSKPSFFTQVNFPNSIHVQPNFGNQVQNNISHPQFQNNDPFSLPFTPPSQFMFGNPFQNPQKMSENLNTNLTGKPFDENEAEDGEYEPEEDEGESYSGSEEDSLEGCVPEDEESQVPFDLGDYLKQRHLL